MPLPWVAVAGCLFPGRAHVRGDGLHLSAVAGDNRPSGAVPNRAANSTPAP
jgi:hypothetical protein